MLRTQELYYAPIITELPKVDNTIFNNDPDVRFSPNIDFPRAQYGFQHWGHINKKKMEILKQFEGKKKVYHVLSAYERYVDEYDKSIGNVSKSFFSLDKKSDKPDILSRGFYKLWEILLLFNVIDPKNKTFTSAHLAEGPGSFIQATMFYRDMYSDNSKNDKYHAVTLHSESPDGKNHVPSLEAKFVDYYKKEKPQRFVLHKTYTKAQSGGAKDKDNGDITDPKTVKLFNEDLDDKVDFITADGGFDWINENVQEQEAFSLIIAQIITAVKIQKKGGNFVCKFFETFTKTSLKMVSILSHMYETVYFVKPLTSRQSNSEKYAVCMNFKYDDKTKNFKDIIKKMDDMLKTIHKNKHEKIVDIFPEYVLPKDLTDTMINTNILVANSQYQNINEIIDFINKNVFYGDEYHSRRELQIEGTKYWIKTFLQESLSTNKEQWKKMVQNELTRTKNELSVLVDKLVIVQEQL